MGVKLNTASGGSVSIEPTNTASNYTLTVPAQTGTVIASDSSGNVGIGTSSPTVKLDVAGRALFTNNGFNYVAVDSTVSDSYFRLASNTTVKWYIRNNVSNSHRLEITPDAGTSTGMFLTQAGDFQMNSGYGSVATAYGCRAWVNFNGTGTVAIRASGGVSSIADLGVGYYQINFTNTMPDTNYSVAGSAEWGNNTVSPNEFATTNCKIICGYVTSFSGGGAGMDNARISIHFFR